MNSSFPKSHPAAILEHQQGRRRRPYLSRLGAGGPDGFATKHEIVGYFVKRVGSFVEYAPVRVRLLNAVCRGIGTMIGYRPIVMTLGERLGNAHLTPAQGANRSGA